MALSVFCFVCNGTSCQNCCKNHNFVLVVGVCFCSLKNKRQHQWFHSVQIHANLLSECSLHRNSLIWTLKPCYTHTTDAEIQTERIFHFLVCLLLVGWGTVMICTLVRFQSIFLSYWLMIDGQSKFHGRECIGNFPTGINGNCQLVMRALALWMTSRECRKSGACLYFIWAVCWILAIDSDQYRSGVSNTLWRKQNNTNKNSFL